MKIPPKNFKNKQVVIVAGPKQCVTNKEMTVVGQNHAVGTEHTVAKNDEVVAKEDRLVATWQKLLARKGNCVAEMDEVVARKERIVMMVQMNVTQTPATSAKMHVGEKVPTTCAEHVDW